MRNQFKTHRFPWNPNAREQKIVKCGYCGESHNPKKEHVCTPTAFSAQIMQASAQAGFTRIELLLIMMIIGILATLVLAATNRGCVNLSRGEGFYSPFRSESGGAFMISIEPARKPAEAEK